MLPKLACIILAAGACACALLAMRQSRLQVVSSLAQTQLKIHADDERLWLLRAQIASRVTPQAIEKMARSLGPMKPIIDAPPTRVAFVPSAPEGSPDFIGPPRPPKAAAKPGAKPQPKVAAKPTPAGPARVALKPAATPARPAKPSAKPARAEPPAKRIASRGTP